MVDLVPPIESLGHAAPVLGPWFDDNSFELPSPNDDLSVDIQPPLEWLPPTGGLLSLAIASSPRPVLLAPLSNAAGEAAFADGSFVALFRLIPEIEERLDELTTRFIQYADAATITAVGSVRQRVRYFAIEIPDGAVLDSDRWELEPAVSTGGATPEERARSVGLELSGNDLINPTQDPEKLPAFPMTELKRPGRYDPPLAAAANSMPRLLKIGATATNPKLWCFDHRGRPIDPGAVAGWWTRLTDVFSDIDQLWGPGITAAIDRRIIDVGDVRRTVHLVSPNEGALGDELDNLNVSNASGAGNLRTHSGGAALTIAGNSPQQPLRVAMLPNGTYAEQVALWPPGNASPPRDMVRVGIVNLDRHLVGEPFPSNSNEAKAQIRPEVLTATGPALLASTDEASQAILDTLAGGGDKRLVTSVLERDFGSLVPSVRPDIAADDFPDVLEGISIDALLGGGEATGQTVEAQRVLVDLQLPAAFAGAWVRVWPQDFDEIVARHIRLDGGSAVVPADGRTRLVVQLPAGGVQSAARMGLEVLILAREAFRIYNDVRFDRPAPIAGDPIDIGAASGPLALCEQGLVVANAAALENPGLVESGTTIVDLTDPPVLVDSDSLQPAQLAEQTIIGRLRAGVSVALTAPAFRRIPTGASAARLATEGAQVTLTERDGESLLTEPGSPLPGLERLEVACSNEDGVLLDAALGGTPTLARYHELQPHQLGHPDTPGATEHHGTGVRVDGPAARPFVEVLRDRTIPGTIDRAVAAVNAPAVIGPLPGPSLSMALLRTVAPGVEAEPALTALLAAQDFPYGTDSAQILQLLGNIFGGLPPGLNVNSPFIDEIVKVINRRVHTAQFGAHDSLHSLVSAIDRAQDLIYVETPAIDAQDIRTLPDGAPKSIWGRINDRLNKAPNLHVLINIPTKLAPGTPRRLEAMRNELFLKLETHPRIGIFSTGVGSGRSLRLASTSVIVDDAYAVTGTTHLWRRGLTYDSSLAVSLFDDQLVNGRPVEISLFRRQLIADRLSLDPVHLPDDPAELLLTIRQLTRRQNGGRLSTESMRVVDIESTTADIDAWNPDGTINDAFSLADWIASLAVAAQLVNSADNDLAG